MVDIGDVSAEMWRYMPLLAAWSWEAFGPQHPRCHVREIRIALGSAWKSRIFVWICRHISVFLAVFLQGEVTDWLFALGRWRKAQSECLTWLHWEAGNAAFAP